MVQGSTFWVALVEIPVIAEPSYETLKANRRISNIEPQNVEGWNRCAQSFFYNIDRIPSFDIRYLLFDIRFKIEPWNL